MTLTRDELRRFIERFPKIMARLAESERKEGVRE